MLDRLLPRHGVRAISTRKFQVTFAFRQDRIDGCLRPVEMPNEPSEPTRRHRSMRSETNVPVSAAGRKRRGLCSSTCKGQNAIDLSAPCSGQAALRGSECNVFDAIGFVHYFDRTFSQS